MDFDQYTDFKDFINKVHIEWEAENAHIVSRDIEYFAPDLAKVQFDTRLTGHVDGTVADFAVQVDRMYIGKSSELSGQIQVLGLPDIERTDFDAHITELRTTPADVELLTRGFANKPDFALPELLHHLGYLRYQGSWIGQYHHFDVMGFLETELGNFQSDLQIGLEEDLHYSGQLSSEAFELGAFLERSDFAQTSLNMQVDASGLSLTALSGHIDLDIPYLDMKGYRYQNLSFTGELQNRQL